MAHELIKGYSQKNVSPRCMIKVDIRKAYDSVEWGFLRAVLLEFGVPYKLVELIMKCVSTVSYSLLLNGGLTEKADEVSMKMLMRCFKQFSEVSRLHANMDKSSLYIAGVKREFKDKMLTELQLSEGSLAFKYLGIPLASKKISIQQCMPLVERIVDRIRSWTSKFLLYAGKLQLIKSVLFEMQTYWAQVFLIPKEIVKMVNGICRRYLWTGSNENSQRNPISWDTLCKPKVAGGLNIINYERWNKAAITKLLWAVVNKKDKLWIKWIHGQYIKRKDITSMEVPKQASWLVRKIFNAREWWANDMQRMQSCMKNGKFNIKTSYIQSSPEWPKVRWKSVTMINGSLPKQQFIMWMAMHKRMATVDRLIK
ncbi:PREDICTED: uncharacterized protein LOC109209363 [Nicotiana attenuata]|uniref:uncharacterized protein LOC109209363 n=1 Tax=Nicotiana attenuata TaxID=49451 RepID=UPI000904F772|nr:PREDICTED: uncharacterized protein LOC109209363 [Nicotiana attenuata]